MHIHIPEDRRSYFSTTDHNSYAHFASTPYSPDVLTPATPDHPLLADRPILWLDVELSADPIMDIGNVLNLQTQVAHGVSRPQLNPVQKGMASGKPPMASPSSANSSSSSSSSSSASTSTRGTPPLSASTRCTRCRRTVSLAEADDNAVSFGAHIYYCGACTRLLESRG